MSLSPVDLCNLALSRASGHRITQITALGEASNEARQCAAKYSNARRIALRTHPWRFASKRMPLASIGDGNSEFRFRYHYPNDCLQIRAIEAANMPRRGNDDPLPFETELGADNTRSIVCDLQGAILVYTFDVEDPNVWDSLFYDALAWQLGAELALAIGNDGSKARFLEDRARLAWDDARTADAREDQGRKRVCGHLRARQEW